MILYVRYQEMKLGPLVALEYSLQGLKMFNYYKVWFVKDTLDGLMRRLFSIK